MIELHRKDPRKIEIKIQNNMAKSYLLKQCLCLLRPTVIALLALYWLNFSLITSANAQSTNVARWRRHVVSMNNTSFSGNPFELEVDGTFTHAASGTVMTLPGYYAGNNTWKIGFMPTLTGQWTYSTSSSDSDLNGLQGSLTVVESGLPGILKADPAQDRKWMFSDGTYAIPIALRLEFFFEPGTDADFTASADFLKNEVKGHLFDTRLADEFGFFNGGRKDYIFSGNWQNHQFDTQVWDKMEERMDVLTERGLGAHIMFYSDDAGEPGWGGQTATEALVIRYVVARLAGYPIVWFNSGIDIDEYRSQADINWWGQQIKSLDPYGHPVSSRRGGGSGVFVFSQQNFDSRGDRLAIINDMTGYFNSANVPVSMDDAWGENYTSHPEKDFRPEDIRRAFWKVVAAGGLGGQIRGDDGYFHMDNMKQDLESEQWLGLINPFVQNVLGSTFGTMVPSPTLVSNGYALADSARTKIFYFLLGNNDKWDTGNGGNITLRLSGLTGTYVAKWFDTRTGQSTSIGALAGGNDHVIMPPSSDDWVLVLDGGSLDSTPPTTPVNLGSNSVTGTQVTLFWSPASDATSGVNHYRVYRNNAFIGTTTTTTFLNSGLSENVSYTYEVSAVDGVGLEGQKSLSYTVTTASDTTPPAVSSIVAVGDPSIVRVVFSEPVEEASATSLSNYTINNGISILSASLGGDLKTVTLTSSPHTSNVTYQMAVNNVRDRALNPNTMLNTSMNYSYSALVSISNLSVNNGQSYEIVQNGLADGALVYIDRSYTYTGVHPVLTGATYIKTANDDKNLSVTNFLSFNVNQAITLYLAHDDRVSLKPAWMASYTDTGQNVLINNDPHSLWTQDFPAGTLVLGGNTAVGSSNMYTVIIVPQGTGLSSDTVPPAAPTGLTTN